MESENLNIIYACDGDYYTKFSTVVFRSFQQLFIVEQQNIKVTLARQVMDDETVENKLQMHA